MERGPVAFMTARACAGKPVPLSTTVTFETVQLVPSLRWTSVSVHPTCTSMSRMVPVHMCSHSHLSEHAAASEKTLSSMRQRVEPSSG